MTACRFPKPASALRCDLFDSPAEDQVRLFHVSDLGCGRRQPRRSARSHNNPSLRIRLKASHRRAPRHEVVAARTTSEHHAEANLYRVESSPKLHGFLASLKGTQVAVSRIAPLSDGLTGPDRFGDTGVFGPASVPITQSDTAAILRMWVCLLCHYLDSGTRLRVCGSSLPSRFSGPNSARFDLAQPVQSAGKKTVS